jgi:predicted secreted protein
MAQQTGTGFKLQVYESSAFQPLTHSTSHDWGATVNMLDITTKDSAGDKEQMPGLREKSCSAEFQYDAADTYNFDYLFEKAEAGTKLQMRLTDGVTGHKQYTFYAYVSNLQLSAPDNEVQTFTLDIAITGAVTTATIS